MIENAKKTPDEDAGRRYRQHGCDKDAMMQIINNMAQSRNAHCAAMQMVTSTIVHLPIAGADPILARRLFHRNRHTTKDTLLNPAEHPNRREAARLRLEPWP